MTVPNTHVRGDTFAIRNVTVVLPDALLQDGCVIVEQGIITDVRTGTTPDGAIDGHGLVCMPGMVDTHNDGIERELMPRPNAPVPMDFALRAFEARVRSAGITTLYHGISWENDAKWNRSVELARRFCDTINEYQSSDDVLIDHRILHRLDARDGDGSTALREYLEGSRTEDDFGARTPLVSFEDHTPGQGQYTDSAGLVSYLMGTKQLSLDAAKEEIQKLLIEREQNKHHRITALEWICQAALGGHIRLIGHDLATPQEVAEAGAWGAYIAEFPTTLDAARLAKDNGLRTVCGAPNVLRGGSHSGNVGAIDLIREGLCDGLCSDYLPYGMIAAVATLVADNICTLPAAARLVSRGPALTVGLEDRGLIARGMRGDLVLARFTGRIGQVVATFSVAGNNALLGV